MKYPGLKKSGYFFIFTNYYQINDVKHVPSNGILVIPNNITTEIFDSSVNHMHLLLM